MKALQNSEELVTFKVRQFDRFANASQADFPRSGHGAEAPRVSPGVPIVKTPAGRGQRPRLICLDQTAGVSAGAGSGSDYLRAAESPVGLVLIRIRPRRMPCLRMAVATLASPTVTSGSRTCNEASRPGVPTANL